MCFFFFCPFCCGALLLWKEVQAGRTPQLRKQNQTKQHLHKDHLDFIQQMFSLSLFFFLMYLKATKLARAKSACNESRTRTHCLFQEEKNDIFFFFFFLHSFS